MKTYIIQWNYHSHIIGTWKKGEEVQLEPDLANWANHDSPGVLVEKTAQPELPIPHLDRMVKKAKRRGGKNE